MTTDILTYVIIGIGAFWGVATLIGLREEENDIKEMCESARKATEGKK